MCWISFSKNDTLKLSQIKKNYSYFRIYTRNNKKIIFQRFFFVDENCIWAYLNNILLNNCNARIHNKELTQNFYSCIGRTWFGKTIGCDFSFHLFKLWLIIYLDTSCANIFNFLHLHVKGKSIRHVIVTLGRIA